MSSSAATTRTPLTSSPTASDRSRGSPRRSSSGCQPRAEESRLEYRAKRFVRAAHLPPLERHHGWKEIFSADARAELTGRTSAFDPVDVYRARYAETEGAEELARLQDVDFAIYLVDDLLVKTDRASMAHSLEARVPFLDPVVTNFAFELPRRQRVRGLSKKVLLRKAAEPLLPREVVHGRKRGFSIPAAAWLRGELEPFARATLSADTLQRQGFFRAEPVTRLLDEHVARRAGQQPAAVGPPRVHALVRAPRRAGAAVSALGAHGGAARMRVWIDMTASAHVLVFRPLIKIMRERGDEVEITARDYAQTLQLLELHGLTAEVIGKHGGRSRVQKARRMAGRLGALHHWAKGRDFDVALAHGSHELCLTARRLGIPSSDTFDYEFATLQHQLGCRAATKVVVPEAIPPDRLTKYGVRPPKLVQYRGPEGGVLPLRLRAGRVAARPLRASTPRACSSSCARRPTSRSTTAIRTRSSR